VGRKNNLNTFLTPALEKNTLFHCLDQKSPENSRCFAVSSLLEAVLGRPKKETVLKKLLWLHCPNHDELIFPMKLNNAHTINFALAPFFLLMNLCEFS
jgi:hypothetical protein